MDTFIKNNYKDCEPIDTICKIRNILNKEGILPIENNWYSSVDSFYSIHLQIPNTNVFSNGKGSTPEFALASAYGEFMERFQNQMFYRYNTQFPEEVKNYKDFFFSPDEIYCDINDILKGSYNRISIYIPPITKTSLDYDLVKKWTKFSPEKFSSKILLIPFYDIKSELICYVPMAILELYYGSNGMCGGNTPEEAMVEGLSEIIERYVKLKVLSGEINPPTIDKEYIKRFTKQHEMIENFEKLGDYKVIIKDCSLQKDFPVIGAIVLDLKRQKYFWSFGCHPIFEIALERTLTEILQGSNIFEFDKLIEYSYKSPYENTLNNKMNVLKDGKGYYPSTVFTSYESYPFCQFKDIEQKSNKGMLKHLLNILDKQNFNTLIRDVSFMGFDSFHIIVPGMSEVLNEVDSYLEQLIGGFDISKKIRNPNNISLKELNEVIVYIEKYHSDHNNFLSDLVCIPMNELFSWHDIKISLFISCAYYKLENYDKSLHYMEKFIDELNLCENTDNESLTWYKCIRDYIAASLDGLGSEKIKDSLQMFYNKELLREVSEQLKNPENIFENYGKLNCWNCDNCEFNKYCYYKNIVKLHMKFKELYYENQINQYKNKDYFDSILSQEG